MGEMGAVFVTGFGVGEVESVGLAASAHRHVGPFPVGTTDDDSEGALGGDTLGFVAGEGVAVVDMTLVDVPGGQLPGLGVTVEPNRELAVVRVDGDDGSEVAVKHIEPVLVLPTQDPITSLKDPLHRLEGGSVETLRCGEVAAGSSVQFGDSVIVGGDEQPVGDVAGGCDMAILVSHRPGNAVVSVVSDDEPLVLSVHRHRPVY